MKFENYLIKEIGLNGQKIDQIYGKIKKLLAYSVRAAQFKL